MANVILTIDPPPPAQRARELAVPQPRPVRHSPPWGDGPEHVDAYLRRLRDDVDRPGFTATLALDGDMVLGWATAWTTPSPFPTGHCHPQISAPLGQHRTADWLCGAREVDELAVATPARGTGLGARLLHAVTEDRVDGRC